MEIANNFVIRNLAKRFNAKFSEAQIFDLIRDGRITIEKIDKMLIAHGIKSTTKTGLINFALLSEILTGEKELIRLIQIINVLGNDRLIKERISSFINGKSMLGALPQLDPIKNAILKLDEMMPGFIKHGWYYAPEALFNAKK